jgi:hypothetical protein
VCLQLYLLPAASSFKLTASDGGEEGRVSILQMKTVVWTIVAFVLVGPLLHVVLALTGASAVALFSLTSLVGRSRLSFGQCL